MKNLIITLCTIVFCQTSAYAKTSSFVCDLKIDELTEKEEKTLNENNYLRFTLSTKTTMVYVINIIKKSLRDKK